MWYHKRGSLAVVNQQRRDLLGDSAIEVLATTGMRGLTHRAVDDAAGLPPGTAKNYFRTRDALLLAAAERCAEHYRAAPRPMPTDRASLAAVLLVMLRNVVGPGRSRMLANLQLRSAYQAPLSAVLDDVAAADFAYFADALRHAGLPATPRHATALTLALHAAAPICSAGMTSCWQPRGWIDSTTSWQTSWTPSRESRPRKRPRHARVGDEPLCHAPQFVRRHFCAAIGSARGVRRLRGRGRVIVSGRRRVVRRARSSTG